MKLKILLNAFLLLAFAINVNAAVTCSGKVTEIIKWSGSEDMSILIEGTGRWLKFTDKTAISMAITAYSAQKTVTVHLNNDNITTCNEGWAHYTPHAGYFKVSN